MQYIYTKEYYKEAQMNKTEIHVSPWKNVQTQY